MDYMSQEVFLCVKWFFLFEKYCHIIMYANQKML